MPTDAQPCPGAYTVLDHEGNKYNTVQIGNQCWTKENMRCKTSPKGMLNNGIGTVYAQWYTNALYYDYVSSLIPSEDRGLLYNWAGALDTTFATTNEMAVSFTNRRGICPEGWHVPNNDEFEILIEYVKNHCKYNCTTVTTNYTNQIAKALSSRKYWDNETEGCAPGNYSEENNSTGFSIVPSGWHVNNSQQWYGSGTSCLLWSSSSKDIATQGFSFQVANPYPSAFVSVGDGKYGGYSVRCLKDN